MVEDKKWKFYTRGSSSSVEPSVSSFTNGTHSSLNSQVEEDELACSIEPSMQYNPYMHFNGHLSGKLHIIGKNDMIVERGLIIWIMLFHIRAYKHEY